MNAQLRARVGSCSEAETWEEIWEAGPYYERVGKVLEGARRYAIFAGWQIDSRLRLLGPGGPEPLRASVIRLCKERPELEFYFLIWDHAYFYVPERELWQARIWEGIHPRVHFIFDNRHPFGASHHEKICVVDGRVALCGGIDLCNERWDTPEHRFSDSRRSLEGGCERFGPYHDLAVQVTGPVCLAIQSHIGRRWREISSIPFPEIAASDVQFQTSGQLDGHRIWLSRTIAGIDGGPRGQGLVREVEFLFRDLIRSASRRIILEGQYYWSPTINDLLLAQMLERRGTGLEIVLILAQIHRLKSLSRQMASYELQLLARLREMAEFTGTKLVLGTPYVLSPGGDGSPPKPVYIHSKVAVIDDRFLSIGSANLAARALRTDTEICLTFEARKDEERRHVREFSERMLEHWHLTRASSREDFQLRMFRPRLELEHHSWLTRLPIWKPLFDPNAPWLYFAKRQIQARFRRNPALVLYALMLACTTGIAASWLLSGTASLPKARFFLPAVLSAALASSWLIPLPFFLLAALAFASLKDGQALSIILASFAVDATLGYAGARVFPSAAARFYGRGKPSSELPWHLLGHRSFPRLIAFLANPLISVRSKIAGQGLYCIPLPWYILATGLLFPSALVFLAKALSYWIRG